METFLVGLKFLAGLQLVSLMVTGAGGLRDVHIHVPQVVLTGSSATLLCRYDLEGDALYTVKWYKGRDEFFRYVPKEHPHTRVFPLPGVIVNIDASGRDRVTLMAVDRTLTSKYRCEVSTDAPDFHTEVVSAHLQVLDPPVGLPQVEVEKSSYAVGDTLRANCSAPWAAVNLNLTWLINGRKVNESEYEDLTEAEAANVTTMSLHTEVCKGGRLRLQCVASLYDVYSTVAEVWLDEDRPRLASVLGTRESSAGAGGLRDVHIHVPQVVLTGSSATLLCRYDLEGDALYTVKWYKGRDEFFRYVPKEHPHTRVFPLPGVIVNIDASGRDRVTLMAVDRTLTSKYRCEVSTDAPDFHTEVVSTHLQVLDPPVGLPQVEVEKSSYAVGDTLRANCSAPWAADNLNLTWLISGRKVNESEYEDLTEAEAANVTTMSLHTEVCKGGRLRLQCVASLYDVYSTVAEIWLDEDRPRLASVRERVVRRSVIPDSRGCTKGTMIWTLSAAIASLVVVS